jgi:hypothetical protein
VENKIANALAEGKKVSVHLKNGLIAVVEHITPVYKPGHFVILGLSSEVLDIDCWVVETDCGLLNTKYIVAISYEV